MRQGGTWKSLKCETAHSGRVTAHVCLNMLTYGFSAIKMFFLLTTLAWLKDSLSVNNIVFLEPAVWSQCMKFELLFCPFHETVFQSLCNLWLHVVFYASVFG